MREFAHFSNNFLLHWLSHLFVSTRLQQLGYNIQHQKVFTQISYTATMKFCANDFAALLAACLLLGPTMMVSAERKIKYLFNSTTDSCTEADMDKVEAIFLSPLPVVRDRRQLRSAISHEPQRELWPRKCANDCDSIARGRCHVTDCKGYRRELQPRKRMILIKRYNCWLTINKYRNHVKSS